MSDQKRKINIFSLAGFILVVVSVFFSVVLLSDSSPIRKAVPTRVFDLILVGSALVLPAIGCVFAMIGLKQFKKGNWKGKGFAIAALVIGGLEVIISLCGFLFVLLIASGGYR